MSAKTLLLIDDDDILRASLRDQLLEFGGVSQCTEAQTGVIALEHIGQARFDLILLDVGLPDMDGRDVCRQIRAQGVQTPIIMLTAADSDDDTITGLDAGANDYVTKPFRLNVLLARMKAQFRQYEQTDDAIFKVGPYQFQPSAKILEQDGRKVRLTEKETNILKFLYRAAPETVGRDTLLHEVWGYNPNVTTHTLETHIYRLRQKIEPDPSNAAILVTDQGGYRLEL
jgi:DNA-binding response OmpR family regulator